MRLKDQLPQLMDVFSVDNPYCNHVDFLFSVKVNEHVNDPVKGILRKTDAMGWRYSGPSPSAGGSQVTGDCDCAPTNGTTVNPISASDSNLVPDLDYFAENLDAIIASAMPRTVGHDDEVDFVRERELQKFVFGKLIEFVNSAANNRRRNGSNDESSGRTNIQKLTEKSAHVHGSKVNDQT
jgi:hypothetical protein